MRNRSRLANGRSRYWSHVVCGTGRQCWLWTDAISGNGHGRFQLSDRRWTTPAGMPARQTFVVIAHRFGYALHQGVDALLDTPIVAHNCDNPLCQNPACWRASNHRANGQDLYRRRDIVRGPLADVRGARGRARAVRDAARNGQPVEEAVLAGLLGVRVAGSGVTPSSATLKPPARHRRVVHLCRRRGRDALWGITASDSCPVAGSA